MGPPRSSIYVHSVDSKPFLLAEWNGESGDIFEEQWTTMCDKYDIKDGAIMKMNEELSKN
eukprot:3287809-Pyramimonas_sp.AAC.1